MLNILLLKQHIKIFQMINEKQRNYLRFADWINCKYNALVFIVTFVLSQIVTTRLNGEGVNTESYLELTCESQAWAVWLEPFTFEIEIFGAKKKPSVELSTWPKVNDLNHSAMYAPL